MQNYSQIKLLGEGSYGKAFLCKRKSDGRLCVIKEIRLYGVPPEDREAALKEVSVLKALEHPFIVSYLDSFHERGNLYIVMEYADGGDLSSKIEKQKRNLMSEDEIMHYFIQLALAIKFLHDRKILHRDLKCQNVFLTKNGDVKLGDFGISKVLDSTMQMCKTQIGTPYYLSPEICEGKPYNSKTDIWSLGCILYELCTLKHAFNANNMNALIMAIIRGNYSPISTKYSYDLRQLVSELLTRDPKRRPSINTILSKPFIKRRLEQMLSSDVVKAEMDHTVLHNIKPLQQKVPFANGRMSAIAEEKKKIDVNEMRRKREEEDALLFQRLEREQRAREDQRRRIEEEARLKARMRAEIQKQDEIQRREDLERRQQYEAARRQEEMRKQEQMRKAEENLRRQQEEAERLKREVLSTDQHISSPYHRRAQSVLDSDIQKKYPLLDPKVIYQRQRAEAEYYRQRARREMNAPNPFLPLDEDADDDDDFNSPTLPKWAQQQQQQPKQQQQQQSPNYRQQQYPNYQQSPSKEPSNGPQSMPKQTLFQKQANYQLQRQSKLDKESRARQANPIFGQEPPQNKPRISKYQSSLDDEERRRIYEMDRNAAKLNKERALRDLEGIAAQAALFSNDKESSPSKPSTNNSSNSNNSNKLFSDEIVVKKDGDIPRPSPRLLDNDTIKAKRPKMIALDDDSILNDDTKLPSSAENVDLYPNEAFMPRPKLLETNSPSRIAQSALGPAPKRVPEPPSESVSRAKEHVDAIKNQAAAIREALNIHESPSIDDSFEEEKPTLSIKRKNKDVPIPQFRDDESLFYRAEAIRAFLEDEIGIDGLIKLKDYILAQKDGAYNHKPFPDGCDPQIVILAQQLLIIEDVLAIA